MPSHISDDFVWSIVRSVTTRLPKIRGMNLLTRRLVQQWYLRRNSEPMIADVFDFKMTLNPSELVDWLLLIHPQLYDFREIAFLKKNLNNGDLFIDAGAYIGFYSLVASRIVGTSGAVLAIEAAPQTFENLCENLALNQIVNVRAVNVGLSDKEEVLRLGLNDLGNAGGNTFLEKGYENGLDVPCRPLSEIMRTSNIKGPIAGAKFDIEGFEYRVIKRFLSDVDREIWPRFIITEFFPYSADPSAGNVIELLMKHGYRLFWTRTFRRANYIMVLD